MEATDIRRSLLYGIRTGENTANNRNERSVASMMRTLGMKSGSLRWPRARPEVACVLLFSSEAVPRCTGNPLSVFAPQKT